MNFTQLDDSQVKFPSPSPPLFSWARESEREKTFSLQLTGSGLFYSCHFSFQSLRCSPLWPFCSPVEAAWERLSFQDLCALASFTFSLIFVQWCKQ